MSDHDDLVAAFLEIDPQISKCDRGGKRGYTHIHGPSQPKGDKRCSSHNFVVEKYNGTVSFKKCLGERLDAQRRPNLPVTEHPLGRSLQGMGEFTHALDVKTILRHWPSFDEFALEVVRQSQEIAAW